MSEWLDTLREGLLAFAGKLSGGHWGWLALALTIHAASLLVRARVWCSIVGVALPGRRVRSRPLVWAYLSGVGVNAIAPARAGDVVRLFAARRALPGARVATLVSTLIAETAFGLLLIVSLAPVAVGAGWLPPLLALPNVHALAASCLRQLPLVAVAGLGAVGVLAVVWHVAASHVAEAIGQLVAGLRILRAPATFARLVAAPQLADWILRGAVAYALLAAFSIHPSVRAAVLVLVVDSVATAVPFTPSGVGAQQALLLLALAGAGSTAQILAFSVGAQVAITIANVLLGMCALQRSFGHVRLRRIVATAQTAVVAS